MAGRGRAQQGVRLQGGELEEVPLDLGQLVIVDR